MGPFELDAEPASRPKFMCWNSAPQCDGVRVGTWESGWGEVRPWGWSLSALVTVMADLASCLHSAVRGYKKLAICNPEELSPNIGYTSSMILDFPEM